MDSETVFREWAVECIWSPWVKPVLFAHLTSDIIFRALGDTTGEMIPADVSGVFRATGTTAIVVDLPGASSITTGLALVDLGYRPIPVYNSVPVLLREASAPTVVSPPPDPTQPNPTSGALNLTSEVARGPRTVVDMYPIVRRLVQVAQSESLKALSLHAPPAFLLDSRRRGVGSTCLPGDFDNRSISLPTDFPSANLLLANRIRDVIVIQEQQGETQQDLAHTLRRWQEAGIRILTSTPGQPPELIVIPRPPRFRHLWYGLLARMGLRQNPLGGYGGFLPVASAG
jgi:hypothetical protein